MKNEVATATKEIVQDNIEETVYNAGSPMWYKRRYHKDGLIDAENLVAEVDNGRLTITNETKAKFPSWENKLQSHGTTLSNLIIDGYGTQDEWFNQPRPYMENANNDLENNKKIQDAIDKGLARQAIKRIK